MFTWKWLPALVPVFLCGCAHGFDHHALQQRLGDAAIQSPDAAISEVRELKPQLRFPCRIAVYLKPSGDHDWRWTPEDKAAMELWAAALQQDGIAADVFTLPEVLVGKEKAELKDLRLAAAKCGADVLFVVHGAAQTDSYKNFAAVFNITVVGGYVVPASHKDTLFLMEGVLIDVDNGYIYTGVQAEGVGKIMRPTFVIEDRDSITLAKTRAVSQFGDQTLKRMRVLATAPVRISDVPAVKPTPDKVGGRIIIEGSDITPTDGKPRSLSNLDLRPQGSPDVPVIKPTPLLPAPAPRASSPAPSQEPVSGAKRDWDEVEQQLASQRRLADTLAKIDQPVAVAFLSFQECRDAASASSEACKPLPTGSIWPGVGDIRAAQRNAGGVMTGITTPRPNP